MTENRIQLDHDRARHDRQDKRYEFVPASELFHVESRNRIVHPAKEASDEDISKIFDFDREEI